MRDRLIYAAYVVAVLLALVLTSTACEVRVRFHQQAEASTPAHPASCEVRPPVCASRR